MMRNITFVCIGCLALLSGCDQPTAPKVLEGFERAQDLPRAEYVRRMGIVGHWLDRTEWTNESGPTPVRVSFDAAPESLAAFVFERVYLPPIGSGGRPISRRTVMLWNFARGIAVAADVDTGATPLVVGKDYRLGIHKPAVVFGHGGALTAMREANEKSWTAETGVLRMIDEGVQGECPSWMTDKDANAMGRRVVCARVRFAVDAQASLSRIDTTFVGIVPSVQRRRLQLSMSSQEMDGIRMTVQCPQRLGGFLAERGDFCFSPFAFWRDQSQYARELDVDLMAIRVNRLGDYYRDVAVGSGCDLPRMYEAANDEHPCRAWPQLTWVARLPNGTVVARSQAPVTIGSQQDTLGLSYDGMRSGGRRQFLSFMRFAGAPPNVPVVIDCEVHGPS